MIGHAQLSLLCPEDDVISPWLLADKTTEPFGDFRLFTYAGTSFVLIGMREEVQLTDICLRHTGFLSCVGIESDKFSCSP